MQGVPLDLLCFWAHHLHLWDSLVPPLWLLISKDLLLLMLKTLTINQTKSCSSCTCTKLSTSPWREPIPWRSFTTPLFFNKTIVKSQLTSSIQRTKLSFSVLTAIDCHSVKLSMIWLRTQLSCKLTEKALLQLILTLLTCLVIQLIL